MVWHALLPWRASPALPQVLRTVCADHSGRGTLHGASEPLPTGILWPIHSPSHLDGRLPGASQLCHATTPSFPLRTGHRRGLAEWRPERPSRLALGPPLWPLNNTT